MAQRAARDPVPPRPPVTGAEEWPLTGLDVGRIRRGGVRPVPFRQFVVKVNGRCNLACRYCYVYFGADSGWRHRPAAASTRVLRRTAQRIGEHATAHRLPEVSLVMHGGEPLLSGAAALGDLADLVRAQVPPYCTVHVTVQTNGTLLTEASLRTLAAHRIRVGVSLDGGAAAFNTERVDHAGRPAWPAAIRGLRLLADHYPEGYAGLLCVVDRTADPRELCDSLLALRPPTLDFLLPLGNWSRPPPGLPAPADDPAPYGDWLCAAFDTWWRRERRETRIRLYEECVALLLGLPAATESLGLTPFTALVVETDGTVEQVDSLRSTYEGAAATGLDVFRHPFDQALDHPGVVARQAGLAGLAEDCRACPVVGVCGGGQYAHRYRAGRGFHNPSVYCADLQRLIGHVAGRLAEAAGG